MIDNLLKPFAVFLFTFAWIYFCKAQNGPYTALFAQQAPKIDGDTSDQVWMDSKTWYTYNQVWLNNVGTAPTPEDFSWKFKLAWTKDRFYILAVITDDIISDRYPNALDRYYDDDCFEVFFDEDKSGGQHQRSFQAFAYHVSLKYDIVDSDNTGAAKLFNDHAEVRMDTVDGKYVWEAAFKVYDKNFTLTNPGQPVSLFAGKKMGWALSYCDNDGKAQRDHFFGSEYVSATDKNIAYINADVFGTVELINPSIPTFSHVLVDNGLVNPTAMQIAPNGDIYVCEQKGNLKVLQNGELQALNLVHVNANTDGPSYTERGLLGLALDPHFTNNHFIYLFYTTAAGFVHNRVSRFTLDGLNDVSSTEVIITELDSLSAAFNHNGGAMHFGKDGKLYIATGENATPSNSQDLKNTHGKLLRINSDGSIPHDNPFEHISGADPRIWSYGLRNPFTFDISTSGKIFLNDVGFETWEEIDDASVGAKNYGWPIEEGLVATPQFEKPVYVYNHTTSTTTTDSTGCAITGGVFFEPLQTNYPQEYIGKYFFMDYCGKWMNMIDPISGSGRKTFATNTATYPIAIDHHPDGNLYYLTRQNGSIYKIVYSGQPVPIITRQPEFIKVMVGQELKIPVSVSGAEPMTYVWKKNGVVVSTAKGNELTMSNVQYADSGMYSLTVSNAFGVGETKPIKVQVVAYNSAPVAMIDQVLDLTFQGGQTYKIVGHATDLEDGPLSGSSFSWSVDLYHGTHVHDGIPVSGNENMEFTIPVAGGHTETNIFYRVTLLVKDSKGLMDTVYVDLYPEIVNITIETEPSGLKFTLDGTPYTAPYTFKTVKGIRRTLGALDPQSIQDTVYEFQIWEHSANTINFIEPLSDSTYFVQYKRASLTGLDSSQDIGFKVYPNPIDESFIIEVLEGGTLHVLDAKGRMVIEHLPIHTGENKINLNLDRGLYQLVYKYGGNQKQIKMMKE